MRSTNAIRGLLAAGALMLATFAQAQMPAVRISEFHYDNTGADSGEQVEVSAPAGTDLTGWSVVLYNGNGGASYDTLALGGVVPATCDTRGVVVVPAVGMQNGAPDGLALVDSGGAVVEFLSYEGAFAATSGPALGLTSIDIGVSEAGNEPVGLSLARAVDGSWSGPAASTFGACNDDGTPPPPADVASVTVTPASATVAVGASTSLTAAAFDIASAPIANVAFSWSSSDVGIATVSPLGVVTGVAAGDATITATAPNGVGGSSALHVIVVAPPPPGEFHINEIHYDNVGVDVGEAIEIEGPAGASIEGFSLVLYDGTNQTTYGTPQTFTGVLPASCDTRGVAFIVYPSNGVQNGSPDGIALLDGAGNVLEFISYEGVFTAANGPAAGLTSVDIGASQNSAPVGNSLQRSSTGFWSAGVSNFGACNPDTPTPSAEILFSGRVPSDPPLPVGYEDQLFATLRLNGTTVPTTFTWSTDTPAIVSIEQNGVMHALAAGTAILRATAEDGTTDTWSLPTAVAVAGTTAIYGNNTEFGDPVDGDPSDDLIVRRDQYTASYSPLRNSPNWVAYDLDASHFGPEDRCDCFTMDPELPASLPRITTDDFTGAGAIAGYGIDRGHLARSFDRTTGSLDNATTYLFSNIIPQAADNNQGPWAALENDLGNFARNDDREVYVIAGVAGNKGTLKDLGRVVIPTHTWKVAVIVPRDTGLAEIQDYRDLEVIAVILPNDPGIRNVPWQTYLTTVDAVEALSGYDLLEALPDAIEAAVESGTQPPIGMITGTAALEEGGSASFDSAGSLDPNGTIVSYSWNFGDGAAADGPTATHTYLQDGSYTVTLTLTDDDGLASQTTFAVAVSNVAPSFAGFPDATRAVGETYTLAGSFVDPGADAWSVTVDWGDGSSTQQALATREFSADHAYAAAGSYTVTFTLADDDDAVPSAHVLTVVEPPPTLAAALPLIDELVASHAIGFGVGAAWKAQVLAAQRLIERGNEPAAKAIVRALVLQIDLLVRLRQVAAADVAPLRSLLVSVI